MSFKGRDNLSNSKNKSPQFTSASLIVTQVLRDKYLFIFFLFFFFFYFLHLTAFHGNKLPCKIIFLISLSFIFHYKTWLLVFFLRIVRSICKVVCHFISLNYICTFHLHRFFLFLVFLSCLECRVSSLCVLSATSALSPLVSLHFFHHIKLERKIDLEFPGRKLWYRNSLDH